MSLDNDEKWQLPDFGHTPAADVPLQESATDAASVATDPLTEAAYQDGFRRGLVEAERQIVEQQERLGKLIEALSQPAAEHAAQLQKEICALAMAAATVILQREIHQSAEDLERIVRAAIAVLSAPAGGPLRLLVCEQDSALLSECFQSEINGGQLVLEVAAECRSGDCRVVSDNSCATSGIAVLIEQIALQCSAEPES